MLNGNGKKAWVFLTNALLIITLAGAGFALGGVVDLQVAVARIESNHFTDEDSRALERRITDILPPKWLIARMDRFQSQLDRIEDRLDELSIGESP